MDVVQCGRREICHQAVPCWDIRSTADGPLCELSWFSACSRNGSAVDPERGVRDAKVVLILVLFALAAAEKR